VTLTFDFLTLNFYSTSDVMRVNYVQNLSEIERAPEALRSACCAAPAALLLVTAFLLYVRSPSVLTPFGYSALVPAVSPYP